MQCSAVFEVAFITKPHEHVVVLRYARRFDLAVVEIPA